MRLRSSPPRDIRLTQAITVRLDWAMEQAGVPVDLHLFAGQDHLFDQKSRFRDAIAEATPFSVPRYVVAGVTVTTS